MRVYDNGRIEEGQVRIKIYVFHFQSVSKLSIINSSLAFTMLTNYCLLICFFLKRAFYIKMSLKFPQNSSCEFANKCRYAVGCVLIITLAKKKIPWVAARKNKTSVMCFLAIFMIHCYHMAVRKKRWMSDKLLPSFNGNSGGGTRRGKLDDDRWSRYLCSIGKIPECVFEFNNIKGKSH